MGAGDVARDRQAQARAAGLQVAAFVETVEGAEGFLAPCFGNARPVIVDDDSDAALVARSSVDRHMAAMLERIVDQIGQAAAAARCA